MRARAVVAIVVGIAAALTSAGCGDDEPSAAERRGDQVAAAARDAGLSDEVADVLALAARGVDGTFHITYEVADPAGGAPQRVTVTQRPPDRRIDIARADGSVEATIAIGGTSYQCSSADPDAGAAAWQCELLAEDADPGGGLFDPALIDALVTSLTDSAADHDFVVEQRPLVGVDATCLVTRPRGRATAGRSATLCLSAEGARLLTEIPSGTLRAVDYGTDITDDAFTLPADPTGPTGPTGSTGSTDQPGG